MCLKRLPNPHLRLVIGNAIIDRIKLEDLIEKLWREDPDEVSSLYEAITARRINEVWRLSGYHRRMEERSKRQLPSRRKIGLTLNAIAKRKSIQLATLVALMEHHDLLEMAQFGLDQKRRMVTDNAFKAELGHNVIPANRIGHLEGYGKAAPFAVFYEDRLEDVFWMLNYEGIKTGLAELVGKKAKLAMLLDKHPYLPDQEIATLAGYSRRAVINARHKSQPKPVLKAA